MPLAIAVLALVPAGAAAHVANNPTTRSTWSSWHLDPLVAFSTLLAVWFYLRGLSSIWSKVGRGNGIRRWRVASFAGGVGSLILALCSPVDDAGNQLLAAHMLQHMLLILFAAPLLVLGAPLPVLANGLPRDWRAAPARLVRSRPFRALCRVSSPLTATLIQAVIFWLWHLPTMYQAALRHESVHALEHFSMLASGIWFWASVLPALGRRLDAGGLEILAIALAGMQCGMLGALLTFSGSAWYPVYSSREALWHLTPAADQEIAGLVMWIPGGTIYLLAASLLVPIWLRSDERRTDASEARARLANEPRYAPSLGVIDDR